MFNIQYSIFNPIRFRSSVLSPVVAVAVVLACVVAGSTQTAWAAALTIAEQQAKANFDEASSNNKDLTLDQFRSFIDLNASANIGNAQRIQDNSSYANAFSDMDYDSNGKVTFSEYLKYEKAQRSQSNRDYDRFSDMGANTEGVVRRGE